MGLYACFILYTARPPVSLAKSTLPSDKHRPILDADPMHARIAEAFVRHA